MTGFALRLTRLTLYLALTLPLMAVQAVLVTAGSRAAAGLPLVYHRVCCRIFGFRVEVRGAMSERRPTLFVANHVSYTDIPLLGSLIRGSFIAKTEVAGWPLFGWLAKLQRTVFVDRRVRSTATQKSAIATRLAAGDNLILFPEGTSGDGTRVLPFKSALLSAAEPIDGRPVAVQPVSIAYARLDGIPLGRLDRAQVAWYGDMELAPHMWSFVGLGRVTVVIEFHPMVTLAELGSRKALAEHCRNAVVTGVAAALSGRLPALPAPEVATPPAETPSAGASSAVASA
jgi:1-acyl-sn-glycerol-3-phosphate acyltransferase